MKKIILLLTVMIAGISANAQSLFPNTKINVSLLGGCTGYSQDISSFSFGMSATIQKVYVDFYGMPAKHHSDTGIDKWDDKKCYSFHGGYSFDVAKNFRLIPIIGYTKISRGETDGSDWGVSNSGIENKYNETASISGLDFGGVAVYDLNGFIIDVSATKYSLMAGIGVEFNL